MIAATSLAPFQKCVAPGTSSSSTLAPARPSASASRTLCAAGTRSSTIPCSSRMGGASALAWRHRAGLPGQVGHGRGRRAEQPRLAGVRPRIRYPSRLRQVGRHARQVGDREPGHRGPHRGPGQRGQQREMAAGRVAPQEHPARVQPVVGGMVPDPAHRGAHVLQRRREAGLAAEPVVDRRHRETLSRDLVVEVRPEQRRRVAPRAALPPAAVHVHHDGHRPVRPRAGTGPVPAAGTRAPRRTGCPAPAGSAASCR